MRVDAPTVLPSSRQATFWEILAALSLSEIRESRELTVIGIAKWMIEPLSFMAVYVFFLGSFLGKNTAAYPLFLLCALVPWRFFTGTVLGSMLIVERNAAIITNFIFPRHVLPLVLIVVEGATFLLALLLFVPLLLYYRIFPGVALVWLPAAVVVLVTLCIGTSYLAAVFGLRFPSLRPAAQNLIRLGFFASAGLFRPIDAPHSLLRTVLEANPLSGIFESFRAVILRGQAPAMGDLLYPFAVGLALLAVGVRIYNHVQRDFAKRV